jgi:phosphopentomutase
MTRLPPLAAGYSRFVLIVLDGLGIGSSEEAGDPGAHTFGSVSDVAATARGRELSLPHLEALGLLDVLALGRSRPRRAGARATAATANPPPAGYAGSSLRLIPRSRGKDTLTGHWELAGLVTEVELRTFPAGLPDQLMAALARAFGGRGLLGGQPASGTQIIEELGLEHLATGSPIVYTSADSVLQVAAHEQVIPVDELYRLCEAARRVATDEWLVGRVIARPFAGPPGRFYRTAGRRDYALAPPRPTVLDAAASAGVEVVAVGKVGEVFLGQGITRSIKPGGNQAVTTAMRELLAREPAGGARQLVFANLNDFDTLYGHRRDAAGFADALEAFDADLGRMLACLAPKQLLAVTADHGCDPGYAGTDHTREDVPLFLAGTGWPPACYGVVHGLSAVAGLISAAFGLQGFHFWPRTD